MASPTHQAKRKRNPLQESLANEVNAGTNERYIIIKKSNNPTAKY